MLTLEKQKCRLVNLNPRAEKHGEETVPAADLKITFDAPNDLLSEFDPALKSSFYRKPDAADAQQEMLADQPGYLPKLRFTRLVPVATVLDRSGDMVPAYSAAQVRQLVLEISQQGGQSVARADASLTIPRDDMGSPV